MRAREETGKVSEWQKKETSPAAVVVSGNNIGFVVKIVFWAFFSTVRPHCCSPASLFLCPLLPTHDTATTIWVMKFIHGLSCPFLAIFSQFSKEVFIIGERSHGDHNTLDFPKDETGEKKEEKGAKREGESRGQLRDRRQQQEIEGKEKGEVLRPWSELTKYFSSFRVTQHALLCFKRAARALSVED